MFCLALLEAEVVADAVWVGGVGGRGDRGRGEGDDRGKNTCDDQRGEERGKEVIDSSYLLIRQHL